MSVDILDVLKNARELLESVLPAGTRSARALVGAADQLTACINAVEKSRETEAAEE